jgi:protein-tyrosine phosphatase
MTTTYNFDKIIDNLYLGDAQSIQPNFFKLIVNCCPDVNCKYTHDDANKVFYIRVYDDRNENFKLINILMTTNILEKIHNCLQNGEPVLVHCAFGIQRSATIIVCYLIKYYDFDIKKAIIFVKTKRPICFSNGFPFLRTMKWVSDNKYEKMSLI